MRPPGNLIKGLKNSVQPEPASIIDVEVIGVRGGLFSRMPLLLRKLLRALCRLPHLLTNRIMAFFHRRKDESPIPPRALFRAMLQWSARRGVPMSRYLTPNEHLDAMKIRFPQNHDDLAVITELYNKDRYGRSPTNPSEFADAVTAWQRIAQRHK